jgi:hypothetical protein
LKEGRVVGWILNGTIQSIVESLELALESVLFCLSL